MKQRDKARKPRRWLSRILKGLGILLLLILIAAVTFLVPTIWGKPWSIDHFYTRVVIEGVTHSPFLTSQLKILKSIGLTFFEDDVDDYTIAKEKELIQLGVDSLETLRSYDRPAQAGREQVAYDAMEWFLDDAVKSSKFFLNDYNLEPVDGPHQRIPTFMVTFHDFDNADYAGWYVDRISKVGGAIDGLIAAAETRADKGIVPPRFILEKIATDVAKFTAEPPEKNVLFTHFLESTAEIADLDEDRRDELAARLLGEVTDGVYPAWNRLARALDGLEARADDRAGAWKLPDGAAYYAAKLRTATSTEMTAEEVHALGLEQVADFETQLRDALAAEGYEVTSIGDGLRLIAEEDRFHFADTAAGRQEVLEYFESMIGEIEEKIRPQFGIWPAAGVVVKPAPEFMEDSAVIGRYTQPPMDGSGPGIFHAKLGGLDKTPKFNLRSLCYHEAVPGHHTQLAIAGEQPGQAMHLRVPMFNAFAEGWALYAEQLADEQGLHRDPFDRIGYLQFQLLRAVRLVVDTGMHHKRWTREQAVDYMRAHTGLSLEDIEVEVDRYVVWPGQACGYMVGKVKILELRERARKALGDRFSLVEFHDRVLENGALPLGLLEREIDRWIAGARGE